jgi:hypothetical protein
MPLAVFLMVAAGLAACDKAEVGQAHFRKVTYTDDVAPILQKHCAECHLAGLQGAKATGFLVDSYASLMQESSFGPVIVPGSARTSSLYILVSGKDNLALTMPHGKAPMSDDEIETIRVWIDNGAVEN